MTTILMYYVMGAIATTAFPLLILPEEEQIYEPIIYVIFGLLWPITVPATIYLIFAQK